MNELKNYAPPQILPLTYTAVSKHLAADIVPISEFEESFDLSELLEKYGSPLFMVSEKKLRALYRNFVKCFTEAGIDTVVAYSYKTNYLPAVCSILHEEGASAEVVSGMEYSLARSLGIDPKDIIFNGPYKSREELETALGEGALVNIDGFSDFDAVNDVANSLNKPVRVGIRVNFHHGPEPWTKFGFNNDNGDCQKALERIAANPSLKLEMLHNHSGTFVIFHEIYAKATDVLIDVARRARKMGLEPTKIDVGGGFPSTNRLKPFFDLPGRSGNRGDVLFPYAEAIFNRLSPAKDAFGGKPTLVLEPGRAIVDAAVQLACTVVAKKDIPGQGKAIILDAGVNLVPTACWYDHKIESHTNEKSDSDALLESVNVFGPLCMQIDILRERALLPPAKVGEPVIISNVGAYCHTQSMQFIETRPATVLLGPNGVDVIRRRETWRDIFKLDEIPERLRHDGVEF